MKNRAAINVYPTRRRALCQGAVVIHPQPPPAGSIDAVKLQREVTQRGHERNSGVKAGRQNVVVSGPPPFVHPVNIQVEEHSHNKPTNDVDGLRHRHSACSGYDDRNIDESNPLLLWISPRKVPNGHWREKAEEEEVVHLLVQPKLPKHAKGTHNAPNNGGVVENIVSRARPGAARGQLRWITDVLDCSEEPPSCAEAYQGSN